MLDKETEIKQRLSMLMDSELSVSENPSLVDRLESDANLQALWARYHLVGEVLRNSQGIFVDAAFAKRVSDAIANEPQVVVLGRKEAPDRFASVRHKAVTLALAASLAAVAVMVGRSLEENVIDLIPMAARDATELLAWATPSADGQSVADAQFNDYLLTHNETATMVGAAGILPHVRLVSARADR